jgi:hypothetical protein
MSLTIVNDNVNVTRALSNFPSAPNAVSNLLRLDPVIKTGNTGVAGYSAFTVSDSVDHVFYNPSTGGQNAQVVLPAPVPGRVLHFRSCGTGGGLSATANVVVPLAGGSAVATIITAGNATAGSSATLLGTGANWQLIRQYITV